MPYQCVQQLEHINGSVYKVPGKFDVLAIPPIDHYQLRIMRHLSQDDAEMVTRFLNRLKDPRSVRAISFRMNGVGDRGLNQLLNVQSVSGGSLAPDYLKLSVKKNEIDWGKESLLESFESRGPAELYEVRNMEAVSRGRFYNIPGSYMVSVISHEHIIDPYQPRAFTNLSFTEADRISRFLNRLTSINSLRAIAWRMKGSEGGLERLLMPPRPRPSMFDITLKDELLLTIINGQIGWAEGSVLEQFEAEYQKTQQKELFAA